jgi:hypothetical protein
MAVKVTQPKVSEAIEAVRWAVTGNDAASALEARRRARLAAPDAVAFLHFVVRSDGYASVTQRVRSSTVVLEAAGLLTPETRETRLFEAEGTDGADVREPAS